MHKITKTPKKTLYVILPFLILSILTWITYFNTLNNEFVFDDLILIQGNETLPFLKNIYNIITVNEHSYRPVRALSYAIDYHFSGLNPFSYHISNIVYHIINCFLVYLITLSMLSNRATAFFAAIIFAVHPIHTDSVTYIAGRRDILFTLFYLIGFYTFIKYRKSQRYYLLLFSMAAYLLSMGSKEMGVTLPAIFLIYDLINNLPHETKKLRSQDITKALKKIWVQSKYFYSIFFMGALAFIYYKIFINSPSQQKEYYGDSVLVTFLTVGKIIVHYIKLLLFPVNLIADYSYDAFPLSSSFFEWSTLFSFILLFLTLCIILKMLSKNRWIAFGGIWFFTTLLPVCHIIPHHELLAEHYLYLPSYGFCLIAAILFTSQIENNRHSAFIYFSLFCIIVLFSLRIIDRNRDWKDGMTLWSKTVRSVPRCARAQNNLGAEYIKSGDGDYKEAMPHLEAALQIKPDYAEAYNNLGLVYKEQGSYDQATQSFAKAIKYKKRYFEAINNIATMYERKGDYDTAVKIFTNVLKRKPNYAEAHSNLGIVYQKEGQLEQAKEHFRKALQIEPDHVEAHNNLGVWYKNKGLYDEAIEEFKHVLILKPDFAEVRCNMGAVYNNKGWYDRAIDELKEALRLKPHIAEAMNNLGNAYKGKGLYDKAIEAYKETLNINPRMAIPHLNLAFTYLHQKKDDKKALYHFEKALEINPNFPQANSIIKEIEELKRQEPDL